jgi:hypothetical protein
MQIKDATISKLIREIEILKREVRDKDILIGELEEKVKTLNENKKNDEENLNKEKELTVLNAVLFQFLLS